MDTPLGMPGSLVASYHTFLLLAHDRFILVK
jgi:hypothetical protein